MARTRNVMELVGEVRDAKRKLNDVAGHVQRIDRQQAKTNKRTKTWGSRIKTAGLHLATAYATFQGISTVTQGISWYFQSWTEYMDQVKEAATQMGDAVRDLQMMTDPAEWEGTVSRLEELIGKIPQKPEETMGARATIQSMLPGEQWEGKRGGITRRAAMMGAMSEVQQKHISRAFGRMALFSKAKGREVSGRQMANLLSRGMAEAPAGAPGQEKFMRYTPRLLKQTMGTDLTMPEALAVNVVGARYAESMARGSMRPARVLQKLASGDVPSELQGVQGLMPRLERMSQLQKQGKISRDWYREAFGQRMAPSARTLAMRYGEIEQVAGRLREARTGDYFQQRLEGMAKDPRQLSNLVTKKAQAKGKSQMWQNVPMQKAAAARAVIKGGLSHWAVNKGILGAPSRESMMQGAETYWGARGEGPAGILKGALIGGGLAGLDRQDRMALVYKFMKMMSFQGQSLVDRKRVIEKVFGDSSGGAGTGPGAGGIPVFTPDMEDLKEAYEAETEAAKQRQEGYKTYESERPGEPSK